MTRYEVNEMYDGKLCLTSIKDKLILSYDHKAYTIHNSSESELFRHIVTHIVNASKTILRSEDPKKIYNLIKMIDTEYHYKYDNHKDAYLNTLILANVINNTSVLYNDNGLTDGYKSPIYNYLKGHVLPFIRDRFEEYVFSYQNNESKLIPIFENSMELVIHNMYEDDDRFSISDIIVYNYNDFIKSKCIPIRYLTSASEYIYNVLINIPIDKEDRSESRYCLLMHYYYLLDNAIEVCNSMYKEYSIIDVVNNLYNMVSDTGNTDMRELFNDIIRQFNNIDSNIIKEYKDKFNHSIYIE